MQSPISDYLMSLRPDAMPHHTFLFVGSERTEAYTLATAWLSHLGITEQITLSSLDDEGVRESISVKKVRECIDRLSRTSFAPGIRAVIINRGDDLSDGASNALLKILEEPPPQTLFLIHTTDIRVLLKTIVSRCFAVRFPVADHRALSERYATELDSIAYRASHSFADGCMNAPDLCDADWERLEAFLSVQLHAEAPIVQHARIADVYGALCAARAYAKANMPHARALESIFL